MSGVNPDGKYTPPGAENFQAGRPEDRLGGSLEQLPQATREVGPDAFRGESGTLPMADQRDMRDNIAAIKENTGDGQQEARDVEAARQQLEKIAENTEGTGNQEKAA